jgi:AcrR family transcriptional regulator
VSTEPTTVDGQVLGARGIRTRQRILDAVGAAIEANGVRGLRLADVAAEVGFSPPAFYQYFTDLDDAILALCAEVGETAPRLADGANWDDQHTDGARPFIEQFFEYWDEHRSLLTARHMAIQAGDSRHQEVANDAFRPLAEALQGKIEAGQRDGRIDPSLQPVALGAVLNMMLDLAAMASPQLSQYWDSEEPTELVAAISYVFDRTLGNDVEQPTPPAKEQGR